MTVDAVSAEAESQEDGPAGVPLVELSIPAAYQTQLSPPDEAPGVEFCPLVAGLQDDAPSIIATTDNSGSTTGSANRGSAVRAGSAVGEIQLASRFTDETGRTCHEYVQTVRIAARAVHATEIVCKPQGGIWRVTTPSLVQQVSLRP